jgi:hypothetical protein
MRSSPGSPSREHREACPEPRAQPEHRRTVAWAGAQALGRGHLGRARGDRGRCTRRVRRVPQRSATRAGRRRRGGRGAVRSGRSASARLHPEPGALLPADRPGRRADPRSTAPSGVAGAPLRRRPPAPGHVPRRLQRDLRPVPVPPRDLAALRGDPLDRDRGSLRADVRPPGHERPDVVPFRNPASHRAFATAATPVLRSRGRHRRY